MERVISEPHAPAFEPAVRVTLEAVITVPVEHLGWMLPAFRRAGIEAEDTGDRTTTEEAIAALADVRIRVVPP